MSAKHEAARVRTLRTQGLSLQRAAIHTGRAAPGHGTRNMVLMGGAALALAAMAGLGLYSVQQRALDRVDVLEARADAAGNGGPGDPVTAAPTATMDTARTPTAIVMADATDTSTAPQTGPDIVSRNTQDRLGLVAPLLADATPPENLRAIPTAAIALSAVVEEAMAPETPSCIGLLADDLETRAIVFAAGSVVPDDGSDAALADMATRIAACDGARIIVRGHADPTGQPADNMFLSWERAEAVTAALRASGVAADRLEPMGFGARAPLIGTDGETLVEASRRVDFSVVSLVGN